MKIQILKIDNMLNNGEDILKNLQNSRIDDMDLLVRESIQNSLDAGYKDKEVIIDFKIGKFDKNKLIENLEGTSSLNNIFKEDKQDFIIISDLNTEGLTGSLSYADIKNINDEGNLLRLVYSMGVPQRKTGAGGSWGYGKTLYYRIGIGIVLYYSRIKLSNNDYEERLVGVLVENQNNRNTVIDHKLNKSTGIAWWGKLDTNNKAIPITDPIKIRNFLDIFGIERLSGTETGTSIIIPFINKQKLYSNAVVNNPDADQYYINSIEEYLRVSAQRWYFPRLNNPYYQYGNKNLLTVKINGDKIDSTYEHKLFKLLRGMYNYAVTDNIEFIENVSPKLDVYRKDINVSPINNMVGNHVGKFVYGSFTYKDLGMYTPDDIDSPIFLSNTNKNYESFKDNNPPMILYTRMPGMIVNYDSDGPWTARLESKPKEEFIIGLFVLNSDSNVYFNTNNEPSKLTLEDYIRSGELDDHMEWHNKIIFDKNNVSFQPTIVSRIIRNINSELRNKLYNSHIEGSKSDVASHIADIIGSSILPSFGFGNSASKRLKDEESKDNTNIRISKRFTHLIDYNNLIINPNNSISLPFTIQSNSIEPISVKIEVLIDTESGKLSLDKYEKIFKKSTPIKISRILLVNKVPAKGYKTSLSSSLSAVHLSINKEDNKVEGKIELSTIDRNIIPFVNISEVKSK